MTAGTVSPPTVPARAARVAPPKSSRLAGVDAARGVALLGMMAAHSLSYDDAGGNPTLAYSLTSGRSAGKGVGQCGVPVRVVGHQRVRGHHAQQRHPAGGVHPRQACSPGWRHAGGPGRHSGGLSVGEFSSGGQCVRPGPEADGGQVGAVTLASGQVPVWGARGARCGLGSRLHDVLPRGQSESRHVLSHILAGRCR